MLKNHVNRYLEAKSIVWTDTTFKSERARLSKYKDKLDLSPIQIFSTLKEQGIGPYTIKTLFIRFSNFVDWCIEQELYSGKNKFQQFTKHNKQLFRNVYNKEALAYNLDKLPYKISRIKNAKARYMANYLLKTGLRISEIYKLKSSPSGEIYVIGKGGKQRRVFIDYLPKHIISQSTFRRALTEIEIKPHDLRKAYATRLLNECKIKPHELCKVMGWSNIQTAMSYLQGRQDDELQAQINKSF